MTMLTQQARCIDAFGWRRYHNLRNVELTDDDIAALLNARECDDIDPLVKRLLEAASAVEYAEGDLAGIADRVSSVANRVKKAVTGFNDIEPINSLGELQGDGPAFDRGCIQLVAARKHLATLAEIYKKTVVAT